MGRSKSESESEYYPVEIEVTDILGDGVCPYGHKIGDKFLVTGPGVVEGLCGWAYNTLFPFISVLRLGGEFPWEEDTETAEVSCPDPETTVIFALRRAEPKKK